MVVSVYRRGESEKLPLYQDLRTITRQGARAVQEQIVAGGFAIIQTLDIRGILKSKGLEILPAFIVEFCDPRLAHRLLSDDPLVLHFLPCKVLVFAEADQTVISAAMPFLMQHFMPRLNFDVVGPTLEAALIKIVDSAL